MRTYTELMTLPTYSERLEYLRLHGKLGEETFGAERYLNQSFYRTPEWKKARRDVIVRDLGCDLAIPELEIVGPVYVHHLNPINAKDIVDRSDLLLNPEYLITVSRQTHEAIHYGTASPYSVTAADTERKPNDTAPWKL